MTIDLSKARKGDRFEARDGEVWTYVKFDGDVHLLADNNGTPASFTQRGISAFHGNDLIRALDTPAPEAGADAEPLTVSYTNWRGETSVRRVVPRGAPYWGSNEWHKEPQWLMCALDVDKGEERDFALKDMASATRIEALTRALEEAGKVIKPLAKAADIFDHNRAWKEDNYQACGSSVTVGHLRAARDWITKHGGGDA